MSLSLNMPNLLQKILMGYITVRECSSFSANIARSKCVLDWPLSSLLFYEAFDGVAIMAQQQQL